jgi:hypothetical protein
MKVIALLLATLTLSAGMTPATSSQQVSFPKDGNGLLDFCGEIVNHFDSPQAPVDQMKFYWCAGYLQATQERISNWRMLAAMQVMPTRVRANQHHHTCGLTRTFQRRVFRKKHPSCNLLA